MAGNSERATSNVTCDVLFVHEDKIARVRPVVPSRQDAEPAARVLAVLGDPTKLRILLALSHEELCVCDIAFVLHMKTAAISHELGVLRDRGLVKSRKEGRIAHYSLANEEAGGLVAAACDLASVCRRGGEYT